MAYHRDLLPIIRKFHQQWDGNYDISGYLPAIRHGNREFPIDDFRIQIFNWMRGILSGRLQLTPEPELLAGNET